MPFVTRSLQHSQQDIQFFLYHVDLVVYVIQRIMIVQAGPAFLQFPWQGEYLLPKFLFCMSRGLLNAINGFRETVWHVICVIIAASPEKGQEWKQKRQRIPLKTVTDRGMKTEGRTCPVLKQIAFIMRLYDNSVPWSCVYIKLSVGTLVLPFRSIPILNNI